MKSSREARIGNFENKENKKPRFTQQQLPVQQINLVQQTLLMQQTQLVQQTQPVQQTHLVQQTLLVQKTHLVQQIQPLSIIYHTNNYSIYATQNPQAFFYQKNNPSMPVCNNPPVCNLNQKPAKPFKETKDVMENSSMTGQTHPFFQQEIEHDSTNSPYFPSMEIPIDSDDSSDEEYYHSKNSA